MAKVIRDGFHFMEYAVVIINLLYPNNLDKVKEERELQIKLMEGIEHDEI